MRESILHAQHIMRVDDELRGKGRENTLAVMTV